MNYESGGAFRAAIEQRIRNSAAGRQSEYVIRVRRMILFDRFLARLLLVAPNSWILKGGVALDFRFGDRARATRDLDLASDDEEAVIAGFVSAAADFTVDDYFAFSAAQLGSIVSEGEAKALRFRIRGELAGRRFEIVHIDVGLGTHSAVSSELVSGRDYLSFAGIPPICCPTIPLAQHLAEKLHAYSRVYAAGRPSSRVKDLVDIALIVTEREFAAVEMLKRLEATFGSRGTHQLDGRIPEPPEAWRQPYREMASEIGLDPDLAAGYRIAATFFDPLLSGEVADDAVWSPELLRWRSPF